MSRTIVYWVLARDGWFFKLDYGAGAVSRTPYPSMAMRFIEREGAVQAAKRLREQWTPTKIEVDGDTPVVPMARHNHLVN